MLIPKIKERVISCMKLSVRIHPFPALRLFLKEALLNVIERNEQTDLPS